MMTPEDYAEHEAEVARAANAPGRTGGTLSLGAALRSEELFTGLPGPLRTRCRRAYEQNRRDTLEARPASAPAPVGASAKDVHAARLRRGTPTLERGSRAWEDDYARWFQSPYVEAMQREAREQLGRYVPPQDEEEEAA